MIDAHVHLWRLGEHGIDGVILNSRLSFRRRARAMPRFRRMKSLQTFVSVHANAHDHLQLERNLVDRNKFKERRSAALAEWQVLGS
ncbi:MAG TPA: hypothetical protein VF485_01495 [Sphingomonas sp.]